MNDTTAARVDRAAPWALGAASFALCAAYFSKWPTEWDSVQLTFGVDRFDIREGSPHPPGYWLYVMAGRVVRALTPLDAQHSLQVLAALAAAATVALVYVAGRDMRGRWLGVSAAALMATSPYLLFYGATPASYCFDALLCVALLVLAVRARPGSRHGLYAALLLGLGSGLRPSSVLVLFPLVVWALAKSVRSVGQFLVAGAAGAVGLAAWIVPMVLEQPGGAGEYWSFSRVFYRPAFQSASMFYGATWELARHNMAHASAYTVAAVAVLFPAALAGLVLAVATRARARGSGRREHVLLLVVAVAVPYLFLLFFYFGKGGYVLSFLPAAVLLALWPAAAAAERHRVARVAAAGLVALLAVVQFQRFAFAPGVLPLRLINKERLFFTRDRYGAPFPLTHKYMSQVDRDTDLYRGIPAEFDPAKDVVVYIWINGGYRFRHGCFTMDDFRVHYVVGGTDHFLCKDGRMLTEADNDIEVPSPDSKVIFTLDVPVEEVDKLVADGRMQVRVLKTGRIVYVAGPGVEVYGVKAVVTPDHPLKEHQP